MLLMYWALLHWLLRLLLLVLLLIAAAFWPAHHSANALTDGLRLCLGLQAVAPIKQEQPAEAAAAAAAAGAGGQQARQQQAGGGAAEQEGQAADSEEGEEAEDLRLAARFDGATIKGEKPYVGLLDAVKVDGTWHCIPPGGQFCLRRIDLCRAGHLPTGHTPTCEFSGASCVCCLLPAAAYAGAKTTAEGVELWVEWAGGSRGVVPATRWVPGWGCVAGLVGDRPAGVPCISSM